MSRWPTVPLGELAQPKQWPTLSKTEMIVSGFPVYGANGRIGYHDTFTHEKPTILIGCRGSCGTVHVTEPKSYANGNAMALDALDETRADLGFLVEFLRQRGFRDVTTGTSQPQIIRQNLVRVEIPLPPLAEQRRIAEVLNRAETLRANRCAALSELDNLSQSIFLDLFGDPITNARDWPVSPIGELEVHIADGNYSSKYPTSSEFIDSGIPFIRANNLRDLTVVEDDLRFISLAKHHELQKGHLVEGDVLITTRGEIGRVAVVPRHFQDANINAQIVLLRPNGTQLDSRYLAHMLNLPQMKIRLQSYQNGVALKQLPIRQLVRVPVLVPPLPLQREFASRARAVEKLKAAQSASLAELDVLFATLQYRAFNGELFSEKDRNRLVA